MKTENYFDHIIEELQQSGAAISEAGTEAGDRLASGLSGASSVFVGGAGRSGLMGKAFAMRLMHLGVRSYVVGETVTPGIGEGDWLVLGSGSGETGSLVSMAQKARQAGAQVAVVTIKPESTLGKFADITVVLPGATKEQHNGQRGSIQPMASLFEQGLLLFYDAIVLKLMELTGQDSENMFGKHANLE
ncbi:6-phospho-3-hexuloisomerase [Paenibacillus sp. CAU 1782]